MSLLLDALKKAELAKQQQAAQQGGANEETTLPYSSTRSGDQLRDAPTIEPLMTRDRLPDIDSPLELVPDHPTSGDTTGGSGLDLALSETPAPRRAPPTSHAPFSVPGEPSIAPAPEATLRPAGPASEGPVSTSRPWADDLSEDRDRARQVFAAKGADYNPRRPFYITLGLLACIGLGAFGYIWWELQPRTFARVDDRARPAGASTVAANQPASPSTSGNIAPATPSGAAAHAGQPGAPSGAGAASTTGAQPAGGAITAASGPAAAVPANAPTSQAGKPAAAPPGPDAGRAAAAPTSTTAVASPALAATPRDGTTPPATRAAEPRSPGTTAALRASAGTGAPTSGPVIAVAPQPRLFDQPVRESATPRVSAAAPAPAAPRSPAATGAAAPAGPVVSVERATPRLDPLVEEGYAAFQRGEVERARNMYLRAAQNDPTNRDAQLGLAAVDLHNQHYPSAEARYMRLLELDPRDPHALAGIASIRGTADPVQSESRLKSLLTQQPDAPLLHFALGNQYATQLRWSEAQQAYFRAFSADPENPDFAFNLAVSLDQIRQGKLAREYYERALRLADGRPAAFDRAAAVSRVKELQQ